MKSREDVLEYFTQVAGHIEKKIPLDTILVMEVYDLASSFRELFTLRMKRLQNPDELEKIEIQITDKEFNILERRGAIKRITDENYTGETRAFIEDHIELMIRNAAKVRENMEQVVAPNHVAKVADMEEVAAIENPAENPAKVADMEQAAAIEDIRSITDEELDQLGESIAIQTEPDAKPKLRGRNKTIVLTQIVRQGTSPETLVGPSQKPQAEALREKDPPSKHVPSLRDIFEKLSQESGEEAKGLIFE